MAPIPVEIGINTIIQISDFDSTKVALRNIFVVEFDKFNNIFLYEEDVSNIILPLRIVVKEVANEFCKKMYAKNVSSQEKWLP